MNLNENLEESHFVGCFLIDEDNKILLQFRGPFAKRLKNTWNCFGGRVEENENLLQAIKREIDEELNISISEKEFIHIKSIDFQEEEHKLKGELSYYFARIKNTNKEKLRLLEGNGWGWFTKEEIFELTTTPNLKKIVKLL